MPYVLRDGFGNIDTVSIRPVIGEPIEFLADNDPELLLYEAIPLKKDELQSYFVLYTGFALKGADKFNLQAQQYSLLVSEIINGTITVAVNVDLTVFDGTTVTYTLANAQGLLNDIVIYLTAVYVNNNSLLTAIDAAPDVATLNAIDVSMGWPSQNL